MQLSLPAETGGPRGAGRSGQNCLYMPVKIHIRHMKLLSACVWLFQCRLLLYSTFTLFFLSTHKLISNLHADKLKSSSWGSIKELIYYILQN